MLNKNPITYIHIIIQHSNCTAIQDEYFPSNPNAPIQCKSNNNTVLIKSVCNELIIIREYDPYDKIGVRKLEYHITSTLILIN